MLGVMNVLPDGPNAKCMAEGAPQSTCTYIFVTFQWDSEHVYPVSITLTMLCFPSVLGLTTASTTRRGLPWNVLSPRKETVRVVENDTTE